MLQSTSPSCLLRASIDAARMQMATEGDSSVAAIRKRVDQQKGEAPLEQVPHRVPIHPQTGPR